MDYIERWCIALSLACLLEAFLVTLHLRTYRMKNPRIKKSYFVVPYSADEVELKTGVWNTFAYAVKDDSKSGNLFKIIKLLDGQLGPSEIAKQLDITRSEVEGLIDYLIQLDAIEYGPTNAIDAYLEHVTPTLSYFYKEKKLIKPILLLGNNSLVSNMHRLLLEQIGSEQIEVADLDTDACRLLFGSDDSWVFDGLEFEKSLDLFQPWKSYFVVFAQDNINPVYGNRFNKIAHSLSIPWINIAVDGPMLFIGPTIIGGSGPCYECFESRVVMNLRESMAYLRYREVLSQGKVYGNNLPLNSVISSLVASFGVLEVLNFIFTECSFTSRKVLSIYLPTMEIAYNEILQLSSCKTCTATAYKDNHQHYFDIQMLLGDENKIELT